MRGPLDLAALPEPVLHGAPELLELYRVAWESAWDHVVERDGMPRSPYLDEGFDPETIWIWDTCFMVHFAKYAPDLFPGVESLENFYRPMYDDAPTTLLVQHPDNPPLFAWSEAEYVRHTGDLERVRWLLDAGYLQRHFAFFDTVALGTVLEVSRIPTSVERVERGYRWNGICSGMDNTPRAPDQAVGGTDGDILWFDAAAQQALAARSIAGLARLVRDTDLAAEYDAHHARLGELVQDFWDDGLGLYCDRVGSEPYAFTGVRTPAAFWPLLAGVSSPAQADALAASLDDPRCFGGTVPWASVARDDPAFRSTGHYWRGGVWVPTAYVSARALADHGHADLARDATRRLLAHMARTHAEYLPASIWECYAPDRPAPATAKDDVEIARPDFCGWSALAPIAMLIEHVLGFRVDAPARTVHWRTAGPGRHGIRRLRCGSVEVSAIRDGRSIDVECNGAVTLVVDGVPHDLEPGPHRFDADEAGARLSGNFSADPPGAADA